VAENAYEDIVLLRRRESFDPGSERPALRWWGERGALACGRTKEAVVDPQKRNEGGVRCIPARPAYRYGRVARPLARATRRAPRVSRRCGACGQYRTLRGWPAALVLVPTAVSSGLLCSPSTRGYVAGLIIGSPKHRRQLRQA